MRRAQRMQAGECELHLGLDACRAGDPASLRGCRQMPEQGGLADPRLAAEDQHTALARAHSRDESFQHVALAGTVEQARAGRWGSSMLATHYREHEDPSASSAATIVTPLGGPG